MRITLVSANPVRTPYLRHELTDEAPWWEHLLPVRSSIAWREKRSSVRAELRRGSYRQLDVRLSREALVPRGPPDWSALPMHRA
ncbi:MAG TPA: hypothetical protein VGI55_16955, partial [Solirubrobacteraceae bacterium]